MRFALFLTVLLLARSPALADDANVTRAYDVRDLLVTIPDFVDAPDFRVAASSTRPAAPTTRPAPTRQQMVEELFGTIGTFVQGVPEAKVSESNGQLIVIAPDDCQHRIAKALDTSRRLRGSQINVEARVVTIPKAAVPKFDPAVRDLLDVAQLQDRQGVPLDPSQVDALLRAIQTLSETKVLTAPRVTLFQGQRAYVLVATQKPYVRDVKTVVTDGRTAYDPQIETVESGILLDITASTTTDGTAVSLDAHLQVAELLDLVNQPAPGTKPEDKAVIQIPDQRILELKRLLMLQSGQSLLLRLPAVPAEKASRTEETYVLLKGTGIVNLPREQKQFPLLKSKVAE
jgi:hypothetical protein